MCTEAPRKPQSASLLTRGCTGCSRRGGFHSRTERGASEHHASLPFCWIFVLLSAALVDALHRSTQLGSSFLLPSHRQQQVLNWRRANLFRLCACTYFPWSSLIFTYRRSPLKLLDPL